MTRASLLSDLLASFVPRGWGADRADRPARMDELRALCAKLVRSRGEASGVRIAAQILAGLRSLDEDGRLAFFRMLAAEFEPDRAALAAAAEAWLEMPGPATLARLQDLSEPPRQELFRRLNLAPDGTAELVRLRERLLPLLREDPETFSAVDRDLRHLFASWFNRGFLVLKPIDWHTSATILERIIATEAVHAIGDWSELRERLVPADRRCFAFFHPSIPDDPLIFVEIALTRGIPGSIGEVLTSERDHVAPDAAETAVFYSISNCHAGLAGVSFGAFLIKQVAEDLRESAPALCTFVTLSPVPRFAAWLDDLSDADRAALEPAEKKALGIVAQSGWAGDPARADAARPGLLSLGARYFLTARRNDGRPLDPVAGFHLGNGAQLHRLLHLGDTSPGGLAQSHGLMVNYLYDLPRVEARHEAYAYTGAIAASRPVLALSPTGAGRKSAKADSTGHAA